MPTLPPAPGTLIDIGGYRLHLQIAGEGTPAVIMDSGSGATSILFALVLPEIAKFTRAVAFDRAGYPWSDPAPLDKPRTSAQIVEELRIALRNAEIAPPYILMGLSFGGINILNYAHQYPDEVAGLIFLDSSAPNMFERIPGMKTVKMWHLQMRIVTQLAKWGLLRPFASMFTRALMPQGKAKLPPELWQAQVTLGIHPDLLDAATREAKEAAESFGKAQVTKGEFGALPLTVLTASKWLEGSAAQKVIVELHREIAEGSTRGEHHIVPNSGHIVPIDRPDVVIENVRKMVEQVRGKE